MRETASTGTSSTAASTLGRISSATEVSDERYGLLLRRLVASTTHAYAHKTIESSVESVRRSAEPIARHPVRIFRASSLAYHGAVRTGRDPPRPAVFDRPEP